jgi:hypothetical protein
VADEAHPAFDPVSVNFELVEKSFAAFGPTKPLAVPAIDDEAEFSATMSAALHGWSPRGCISKSARRSTETEARFGLPAVALRRYKIPMRGKVPGAVCTI